MGYCIGIKGRINIYGCHWELESGGYNLHIMPYWLTIANTGLTKVSVGQTKPLKGNYIPNVR